MQTRALLTCLAPALALAQLAACGGDSGGSAGAVASPPPAPAPTPTIEAPRRLSVEEGSAKALDFRASITGASELSVSLAGPDASRLRVQGESVFFRETPDFENPANEDNRYVFDIVATTSDSTARASVTIDITDVLEARIIDGPVADAIVFVDLDGDGVLDLDEPSTLSDADGYVVVPPYTARGTSPRLIATDGIDTFTGQRLRGFTMRATIPADSTVTFMVTPLTSVIASLEDDGRSGDALLAALQIGGDLSNLRTRDLWQQALVDDGEALRLLRLAQQLAFTVYALRDTVLGDDGDPRSVAAFAAALERHLGEQLISGGLLSAAPTISDALSGALADSAITTISEAKRARLATAVAEVNGLIANTDADPASDTTAAVLAVTQDSTLRRLAELADATLTLGDFTDEQRQRFSDAVRAVGDSGSDTDGDGMLDRFDDDDDGDGVDDREDAFPLDATRTSATPNDLDGDGLTDDEDADDDGDGVADHEDADPRDATVSAPAQLSTAQRFKLLSMATFGATEQLMDDVARLGGAGWVDAQLAMGSAYDSPSDSWPTHLERTIEIAQAFAPDVNFYTLDATDGSVAFNERTAEPLVRRFQMAAWNDSALGSADHPLIGSDELRQRMAYALSQLLVTSTSTPPLDQRGESLAYYYDLLAEHAFGNYRTLLGAVARSPTMGTFLSHAANRKASVAQATRPDENFARELVQLFTLGPYELDAHGEAVLDDAGQPVPAYTQGDIEELAKVMTGWNLAGSRDFNGLRTGDGDHTRPMVFHPEWHEDERDPYYGTDGDGVVTLLGRAVALDAPDRTLDGAGNSTRSGLDASLDVLFAHPNVGPYVAKHLIRHFVTANPSPAYVARVARVFDDDGTGVRGNLGATARAILLDRAAYGDDPSAHKVKEPLLAYTQLLRALDAAPVPSGYMSNKGGTPITSVNIFYESNLGEVIGYAPMRAESVFNFFDPGFVPADADLSSAELLAPEMAMMTDQYFANVANLILGLSNTREFVRYDRGFSTRRVLGFSNVRVFDINFTAALEAMELAMEGDSNMDFANINREDLNGEQIYKAAAVDALVDWIDLNLFGTSMPQAYREALTQHLGEGTHKGEGQNDPPELKTEKRVLEAWELVRDALIMATAIPAYMVQ